MAHRPLVDEAEELGAEAVQLGERGVDTAETEGLVECRVMQASELTDALVETGTGRRCEAARAPLAAAGAAGGRRSARGEHVAALGAGD